MELDLKLTKDSVFVLCHDHTIDRTTTGRGRVCDITYDSASSAASCVRRTACVCPRRCRPCAKRWKVCKDRIVVDIDQGYEFMLTWR